MHDGPLRQWRLGHQPKGGPRVGILVRERDRTLITPKEVHGVPGERPLRERREDRRGNRPTWNRDRTPPSRRNSSLNGQNEMLDEVVNQHLRCTDPYRSGVCHDR